MTNKLKSFFCGEDVCLKRRTIKRSCRKITGKITEENLKKLTKKWRKEERESNKKIGLSKKAAQRQTYYNKQKNVIRKNSEAKKKD